MDRIEIHLTVNGLPRTVLTEPCCTLLELLRDKLGFTGTKEGCGVGDCGACVVLMDGQAVNACLVLAAQAEGVEIITVEGLAQNGKLHPLQHYFAEKWALQCGFCTPGMLMSCYALLLNNPNPNPDEIRDAIAGNLCRCGSYQSVVEAVLATAKTSAEVVYD
jgi:aerobic-type carbon monoxide dehydrogenase small subunit (CoxS/CutS family)